MEVLLVTNGVCDFAGIVNRTNLNKNFYCFKEKLTRVFHFVRLRLYQFWCASCFVFTHTATSQNFTKNKKGALDRIDSEKAVDFVLKCMNFDGGFGCVPGAESHAGQVSTHLKYI
jgi:hypothetical protein